MTDRADNKDRDIKTRIIDEGRDVVSDISGIQDWKRSRLGTLTGVSVFSTAIRQTFGGPVRNLYKGTGKVLGRTFGREEETPSLPTRSSDSRRRFEIAQEVHGRSDSDVEDLTHKSSRQALVFFIAMVLATCWGILILPST